MEKVTRRDSTQRLWVGSALPPDTVLRHNLADSVRSAKISTPCQVAWPNTGRVVSPVRGARHIQSHVVGYMVARNESAALATQLLGTCCRRQGPRAGTSRSTRTAARP